MDFERCHEAADSQRNGEEVKRVPSLCKWVSVNETTAIQSERVSYPCEEGDEEEGPLMTIEHANQSEWIGGLGHHRLQCAHARCEIPSGRHPMVWRVHVRIVLIVVASAVEGA
jgi:hypothetical protein